MLDVLSSPTEPFCGEASRCLSTNFEHFLPYCFKFWLALFWRISKTTARLEKNYFSLFCLSVIVFVNAALSFGEYAKFFKRYFLTFTRSSSKSNIQETSYFFLSICNVNVFTLHIERTLHIYFTLISHIYFTFVRIYI